MPVATSDVSAALTYDGYSEQVMHAIEAKVAIRLPNWVLPP
jgi:type VI protein secretion system component VasK